MEAKTKLFRNSTTKDISLWTQYTTIFPKKRMPKWTKDLQQKSGKISSHSNFPWNSSFLFGKFATTICLLKQSSIKEYKVSHPFVLCVSKLMKTWITCSSDALLPKLFGLALTLPFELTILNNPTLAVGSRVGYLNLDSSTRRRYGPMDNLSTPDRKSVV